MKLLGLVWSCLFVLACDVASAADSGAEKECRAKLKAIGAALAAYERENGKLPDYLSALVPKYIGDKSALLCPADEAAGDVGPNKHMKDPALPCSYEYEFSAVMSNGLASPPGPFPKPDVGDSWGTWRNVNTQLRTFFGPWVPMVRCFHHRPAADSTAPDRILNLVPSGHVDGDVYVCDENWESSLEAAHEMMSRFARDLRAEGVRGAGKKWFLGRVLEHSYGWNEALKKEENRNLLRSMAERLAEGAKSQGESDESTCFLYRCAGRFFMDLGDTAKAMESVRAGLSMDPKQYDRRPLLFLQAEIAEAKGEAPVLLKTYEELYEGDPQNRYIMNRLAEVYEKTGKRDKAEQLRDQADPGRRLVGKPAPEFSVPLLSGGDGSLKTLLDGKKALIINFWYLR
jgi:tetratricopeptide (TPR) repeat protein